MKNILQKILTVLARAMLFRHKPAIIGITGSAGKTSAKEAIFAVLNRKFFVRAASGNLNNELGVPLTILGDFADEYYTRGGTAFFWFKVIFKSIARLIIGGRYPKYLILEYGADRPGDIKKLVSNFRPHISVLTSIGEIPPHVEFFESPEALTKEKSILVTELNEQNFAVLNADDPRIIDLKKHLKSKTLTYGFGKTSDIFISDLGISIDDMNLPTGINFKLNNKDSYAAMSLGGSLGHSHAFAAAAGAAVGLILGMNLSEISEGLYRYKGVNGRLKILKGVKNSVIIDDTYNSSPSASKLALETLKHLPAERKVVIMGDMLELGEYTEPAHREIGEYASRVAQLLITVGARAKFMADAAIIALGQENVISFSSQEEATGKILDLIKPNDLILVKGSQGMRMEKIVGEIMAEQEKKSELLVRQSQKWLKK